MAFELLKSCSKSFPLFTGSKIYLDSDYEHDYSLATSSSNMSDMVFEEKGLY